MKAKVTETPNKVLDLTAISLRFIAAGELSRWAAETKLVHGEKIVELGGVPSES